MSETLIGRRFKVLTPFHYEKDFVHGQEGIILAWNDREYLLEFDEFIDGHSGDCQGRDGYCWWVKESKFLVNIWLTNEADDSSTKYARIIRKIKQLDQRFEERKQAKLQQELNSESLADAMREIQERYASLAQQQATTEGIDLGNTYAYPF